MSRNTAMFSTTAVPPIMHRERKISRRIRVVSPQPKEMDTATPLPMERPSKMEVRKVISV